MVVPISNLIGQLSLFLTNLYILFYRMMPTKVIQNLLRVHLLVSLAFIFSCKQRTPQVSHTTENLLPEVERSLDELAKIWYPKTLDTINGGFWSDFNAEWKLEGKQHKMLVSQARYTWTASTLALFYKDPYYKEIAAHGYAFLKDHMWDSINGGFNTLMEIDGTSLKRRSTGKSAYGNSFAIYALAYYYKASKDTSALNLAKKTFHWLEEHSYDPEFKGYFDVLQQNGSWMLQVRENDMDYDNFARKDWKDQNSSIHLLESFTALYELWPDELLRQRLEELLLLIRDTITDDKGSLSLHLQRDWTPISLKDSTEAYRKKNFWADHVSFGHDVETAFLLLEASHALYGKNDSITAVKAKKMVDHGIEMGWDAQNGGFYDGGYYNTPGICTIENHAKVWWTQAEGLNSLMLMSQLYPNEIRYHSLFKQQWAYIDAFMVDHTNGGWYHEGLDSNPSAVLDAKAHIWKTNYHTIRSLVNVIQMLRGEYALTQSEGLAPH